MAFLQIAELESVGPPRFQFEKEMISRLKCNFLRNQEVYAIYEYTICLLILKS